MASGKSPRLMPLKPGRGGRERLSRRELVKLSQSELVNFRRRMATSPTESNALAFPLEVHQGCLRTKRDGGGALDNTVSRRDQPMEGRQRTPLPRTLAKEGTQDKRPTGPRVLPETQGRKISAPEHSLGH